LCSSPTIFENGDVRNKTKKRAWLPEVTKPKAQALEGSYREPTFAHLTYGDSIVRLAGQR